MKVKFADVWFSLDKAEEVLYVNGEAMMKTKFRIMNLHVLQEKKDGVQSCKLSDNSISKINKDNGVYCTEKGRELHKLDQLNWFMLDKDYIRNDFIVADKITHEFNRLNNKAEVSVDELLDFEEFMNYFLHNVGRKIKITEEMNKKENSVINAIKKKIA